MYSDVTAEQFWAVVYGMAMLMSPIFLLLALGAISEAWARRKQRRRYR